MVMHGPGDDSESFNGIRMNAQKAETPKEGGGEKEYLLAFLEVRSEVMLMEEAHEDLSRVEVQKTFIEQGNFELKPPLKWVMYGYEFCIDKQ